MNDLLNKVNAFHSFFNARMLILFMLGFSSGLPLALTSSTLQAWFTTSGSSIVAIGFLALVGQPYVYKFLWAPFMDRYVLPFLGRRRGWLLLTQVLIILSLCLMAFANPSQKSLWLATLAFLTAFLSASQDIALDAYRTDLLTPEERGLGAAFSVGGYRFAMILSGAVALILAEIIGWQMTYLIMALFMCVGIVTTLVAPNPKNEIQHVPQSLQIAFIAPFTQFIQRRYAIYWILFIILYKLGEAFTAASGPLTNAFLLRGLGFSLTTVGSINTGIGMLATLIGVFVGGAILTRARLYQALFTFGIGQLIAILSFMLLAIVGKNYLLLVLTVMLDNFCNGMGTAALVALIMALCDQRYTATQFALLSALSALGRVYMGPMGAIVVAHLGWVSFYFWSFVISSPAVFIIWFLKQETIAYEGVKI